MHMNESYVAEALRHGAMGYVLKSAAAGELVRALRAVLEGQRYLSPPLSAQDVDEHISSFSKGDVDPYESLSQREREVLHLLVRDGETNAAIAERLGLSPRTVEFHRANLMRKLGVKKQVDLVRVALERSKLSLSNG